MQKKTKEKSICVVVLTFNNERYIGLLANSVREADQVIVVDSGSSDRTVEIITTILPDALVVHREFDDFSSQRNYGLSFVDTEWVVHCDSDEIFTSILWKEIRQKISEPQGAIGFNFVREYYWKSRRLTCCDGPNGMGAVMHISGKAFYHGKVHEKLVVEGPVETLKNKIIHVCQDSILERVQKLNAYSSREAEMIRAHGKNVKYGFFMAFIRFVRTFFWRLFVRKGVLDGSPGVLYSFLQAYSKMLIYSKLWEEDELKSYSITN